LEALPTAHSSPVEGLLVALSWQGDYEREAFCLNSRACSSFWVLRTLTSPLLNF